MLRILIVIFCAFSALAKDSIKNNKNRDIIVVEPEEKYYGDKDVNPSLNTTYAKEIAAVEKYLNSFYTYSANFKQSNRSGQISYGKIYISKPEKIRCEYSNPTPTLLIMNENKVTYYDEELDEISHANADINALKILSLERIKFSNLKLVEVEKEYGFISFTFIDYSKELKQQLAATLKFSYPAVELKKLTVLTEDNEVDMVFEKSIYNQNLSKQLFYFNRITNRNLK